MVLVLTSFFVSHYIFRWRTAMNEFYVANWPRLRTIEGASQRVQEDTMRFATITEQLGVNLIRAVLTLIAFLPILLKLSSNVTELPLIGAIPYSLVFAAVIWSAFGTGLLALIGIIGGYTFGGYSTNIVVEEAFVLRVPENLDLKAVAPLLCAGITTYSPLHHWKVGTGKKVGIVGLGGLGHMGVKFAHALGAHTVLFTTSPGKVEDGRKLGADEVVISKNADEMEKHASSFDFILDCVSAEHDINAYLNLLKLDGTLCQVGAPEKPLPVQVFSLLLPRRNFAGSAIGGIAETQEMLDFCAEHGIVSDVEMIKMDDVNEAYERVVKADVKYRFVIDMATLKD